MRMCRLAVLLVAVGSCAVVHAGTLFTVDPVGGTLSGAPGDTVGWGFTFYNDNNYAVVTSSEYVTGNSLGTYSDYISSVQFQVVGPLSESTTWSQSFNSVLQTGVGEYSIDAGAVTGAHSDGIVQLTYDLYDVDPNNPSFDPGLDLVSSGNIISALASVDVVAATPLTGVPEPSLGWFTGLLAAGCLRRKATGSR